MNARLARHTARRRRKALGEVALGCGLILASLGLLALLGINEARKLDRDCKAWGWTYCIPYEVQ